MWLRFNMLEARRREDSQNPNLRKVFRSLPRAVGLAALLVLLGGLPACSTAVSANCSEATLSRSEILEIVDAKVRALGKDPSKEGRTKVKIRRDGCDYLIEKTYLPYRPGDYIWVRINQYGEIVDFTSGA